MSTKIIIHNDNKLDCCKEQQIKMEYYFTCPFQRKECICIELCICSQRVEWSFYICIKSYEIDVNIFTSFFQWYIECYYYEYCIMMLFISCYLYPRLSYPILSYPIFYYAIASIPSTDSTIISILFFPYPQIENRIETTLEPNKLNHQLTWI